MTSFPLPVTSFPVPKPGAQCIRLEPRPQKYPPGQPCHVGQMRLSDWLKFSILRSDWLSAQPTPFTTQLYTPHCMPYCLLLSNVYRIRDMCFLDLGTVPRFEIRFCICTPDFTVICQNWGDHHVENFIQSNLSKEIYPIIPGSRINMNA